jgi:KaiC/GvpD/RAD55 family RecA-like ATPase
MTSPDNITYLAPSSDATERLERAVLAARLDETINDEARARLALVSPNDFTTPSFGNAWQIADEIEAQGVRPNVERVAQLLKERELYGAKISSPEDLMLILHERPAVVEIGGLVDGLRAGRVAQELAELTSRRSQLLTLLAHELREHANPTATRHEIARIDERIERLAPLDERGPMSESLRYVEDERIEELIDGLIAQNTMALLLGPDGAGKTFTAVALACSVITGVDFLGHLVKKTGPVYYVAAEGRKTIKPRVLAWCLEHDVDVNQVLDDFIVTTVEANSLRLVDPVDTAALVADIKRHGREFGLVVIDTYAMASGIDDENANAQANRYAVNMRHLANATGATVLTVHHPSKDNWLNVRGGGSLRAAQDTVLALNPEATTLKLDKYRHGTGKYSIPVNLSKGHYIGDDARATPVMVAGELSARFNDDQLLDVIRDLGGDLPSGVEVKIVLDELERLYGVKDRQVFNRARVRLAKAGKVDGQTRGVVRILEPEPDPRLDF